MDYMAAAGASPLRCQGYALMARFIVMGMYQLKCNAADCGWQTMPSYSSLDCVRFKEHAHILYGNCEYDAAHGRWFDAHDSAFGFMCPKCGRQTVRQEYRYFSDEELRKIRRSVYDQ